MQGTVKMWERSPAGLLVPRGRLCVCRNIQMVTSCFAIAKALGLGDVTYKINKMYVEFENTAGTVTAPTYDKYGLRTYYPNLAAPKDYLRLDLLGAPTLGIATGYTAYFTAGVDGNQLTFLAQTAGSAGQNGVTFSNALNSTVYGVALVAAPDDADITQDVIVSRGYFSAANQLKKPAAGQLVLSWEIDFTPP